MSGESSTGIQYIYFQFVLCHLILVSPWWNIYVRWGLFCILLLYVYVSSDCFVPWFRWVLLGIYMSGESSTQIHATTTYVYVQWVLCHLISVSPRWNIHVRWVLFANTTFIFPVKSSARRNFAPSQPKSPLKEIIQIILLSLFTLLPVLSSKVYEYHTGFCSFCGVWSLGEYAHETGTRLLKQRFPPALPHHPSTCEHLTSSLLQPQNLPISTHQQCCVLGWDSVHDPEAKHRGQISRCCLRCVCWNEAEIS